MILTSDNIDNPKRSRKPSDAEVLDKAEALVEKFLVFLRANAIGRDAFDTNALPVAKTTLINAFRLVIATEPRQNYRAQLLKAGMTLAHFQDDVGPRMSLLPVSSSDVASDVEIEELMESHRDYILKFDATFAKVEFNKLALMETFKRSLDIAERREQRFHPDQPFRPHTMHHARHA